MKIELLLGCVKIIIKNPERLFGLNIGGEKVIMLALYVFAQEKMEFSREGNKAAVHMWKPCSTQGKLPSFFVPANISYQAFNINLFLFLKVD
jgi:hypothetical protein